MELAGWVPGSCGTSTAWAHQAVRVQFQHGLPSRQPQSAELIPLPIAFQNLRPCSESKQGQISNNLKSATKTVVLHPVLLVSSWIVSTPHPTCLIQMNSYSIKKAFSNKEAFFPAFRRILMRNYWKTNFKNKIKIHLHNGKLVWFASFFTQYFSLLSFLFGMPLSLK